MWKPRHIIALWASTDCYRETCTFLPLEEQWFTLYDIVSMVGNELRAAYESGRDRERERER
jgi:hypothetical protein